MPAPYESTTWRGEVNTLRGVHLGNTMSKPMSHFDALPPLPEPEAWRIFDGEGGYGYRDDEPPPVVVAWAARYGRKHETLFTADALRAYALAARRAALEDASKLCDDAAKHWTTHGGDSFEGAEAAERLAAAIRALDDKGNT